MANSVLNLQNFSPESLKTVPRDSRFPASDTYRVVHPARDICVRNLRGISD